jgi:hypothetical protein
MLASHLCPEELRGRIRVCVVRRQLNEPIDIVLGHSFGDPLCAFDIDIPETEILGRIVLSNHVEHNVRVPHALFNALCVPEIKLYERNSSQVSRKLQVSLRHVIAVGYDDLASSPSEPRHDVPTQEAIRAEDGDGMASQRRPATVVFYDGFSCPSNGDVLDYVGSSLERGGLRSEGRASGAERECSGLAGLHVGMQDLEKSLSRL